MTTVAGMVREEPRLEQGQTTADMAPVTLVQFPRFWGRNISPFGLKLETWLQLADIPYRVRESTRLDKAPKGKLPYILDYGQAIADSTLAIEHLKDSRGIDPDAMLTDRERAEAVSLQRLFEDHLYFVLVYSRWLDEESWPLVADAFFGHLAVPARQLVRNRYRRRVARTLYLQGLGRHSREEIYALGREDLAAVAAYLGERPFFMGDSLTTLDAVAYGFLANIIMVPLETELKRIAHGLPNLRSWCEAIEQGLSDDL